MKNDKGKLLEIRKRIKARKPEFLRQSSNKCKGIAPGWRKPRGIHSKLRLSKRGHSRKVSPGFRSPAEVRGMSREGLAAVLVSDPGRLSRIDPSLQGIIIAKVGMKKRIAIMKDAMARKIKVLNFKDPAAYIKNIEEELRKEKEQKTQKEKDKEKKKEELRKKADEKEKEKEKKLEEALTDEEKKEKEKEEKDKLLTKRI